jgi:hypothetical protein
MTDIVRSRDYSRLERGELIEEIYRAWAEVDRLRTALRQIAEAQFQPNTAFSTALLEVQSWSRRALEDK